MFASPSVRVPPAKTDKPVPTVPNFKYLQAVSNKRTCCHGSLDRVATVESRCGTGGHRQPTCKVQLPDRRRSESLKISQFEGNQTEWAWQVGVEWSPPAFEEF